jgi:butyrate kinase
MFRILAVNPGSSSTKVSVFDNQIVVMDTNLIHKQSELENLHSFEDHFDYRKSVILKELANQGILLDNISAVVGRGGLMRPVESGAYRVNEEMKIDLQNCPKYHASNLGASLADDLANRANAQAFVYDPVSVDEMWDMARLTGLPGVERVSIGHVLNMRSVARQWSDDNNKPYENATLIIAHLGSGITVSLHHNGRIVDMISDDEGSYGPDRVGLIPARKFIQYIYDRKMDREQAFEALQGKGAGLYGLLGTANTIEVETKIGNGDKNALLCYESMAFNVAKSIGQLATEVSGKVDRIILTGGTAHSTMFTGWVKGRVSFIAGVETMPGEREMEAMATGVLRVLQGKEKAKTYNPKKRPPLL